MILARFCFVDLDTLIFAQLSEHLSDILFDLSVYDLSPVFRCEYDIVGLQYILDSGKKKDEGFARIGYCEFNKSNKDRKEVQIPHDNCNTGHEVQAIPNVLREEIWRSTSVAEI